MRIFSFDSNLPAEIRGYHTNIHFDVKTHNPQLKNLYALCGKEKAVSQSSP
jgi:hypothetical protein